ncbi:uncharacterized protein EDB91DRAFT_1057111, partial [Suillus paluster]|uniref:uncharacterized protein n=1 Tax=Suillus paluster TaxID=48578 RepID=UPI001B86C64F
MQTSLFVSFTCIVCCLSAVCAFSVTVGTPTQCDDLNISWTGGQAPFEILLTPTFEMLQNISVPASAFSNGKGSYLIPQLSLASGITFLLTMSDATAFGLGGTTNVLTVGAPVANNNCNTTVSSPPYTFELSPQPLQQCSQFTVSGYSGAVLPVTIVGLIPGGQSLVFNSVTSSSYTSVMDVSAESTLVFFIIDSQGRQGGASDLQPVSGSSNSSCLGANSPSSTAGGISPTASPTSDPSASSGTASSTSSPSTSSGSNVALIAGTASGGAVVIVALVILGMFLLRKRRASRSP